MMVEGVYYESYLYKLSCEKIVCRDCRDVPQREPISVMFNTEMELNEYKERFKNTHSNDMKYYNEWCREWTEGKNKYTEFIMGFVSGNQGDDFYERVILPRKSS